MVSFDKVWFHIDLGLWHDVEQIQVRRSLLFYFILFFLSLKWS